MLEEPSKLTVRSNMKMNFQASQTATNSTPTRRQKAALGRNGSLTCNKYDSIPKEHNSIHTCSCGSGGPITCFVC